MLFGFNMKKALPYVLGGVFLLFVWFRFFGKRNVEGIRRKIASAKLSYITMSEVEKEKYASRQLDLIMDTLMMRVFSSWRDNSDIVALIKGNKFCILRMGRIFDNRNHIYDLSDYLHMSLRSSEIFEISEEFELLRKHSH